ncbi:uncharacterized protein [Spinacia oleracea]|uniref:Ysc84 actin-binding domain-containing protein n=1 Tax=Spinacia oleracea TaxID=3562 RepID=A0A9R0IXT6_SPIOL|nr:uncharacterized protein LOC110796843 [Spinacia oleracea]XP_021857623.2 uncharacterized protein LOC110796843 [Spinacia oleracea]XP_056687130.1 uncharacterized protein LOC110796843 [Spinacia oleracea]
MASLQQALVNGKFNEKQKAAIEKAMQKAQNVVNNNKSAKDEEHDLAVVICCMENIQVRPIMHMKTHDIQGKFMANATPTKMIGGEAGGSFVHKGAYSEGPLQVVVGSKGAVIYGTIDKMVPGLGYLLAWDRPDDSHATNKVYVEAGDPSKLMKMEWSDIQTKMNKSDTYSEFLDKDTSASASAELRYIGNNAALVDANFDRVVAN